MEDESEENDANEIMATEKDNLIKDTTQYKTYHRRWYILILFSIYSLLQNVVWNTYGPILGSTIQAFGWTVGEIAWMANSANISLLVLMPLGSLMVNKYGLRLSTLASVVPLFIGAAIRCFSRNPTAQLWLSLSCGVLTGWGGIASTAFVSLISAVWFPPSQRATATAIVFFLLNSGLAISFIIGPLVVQRDSPNGTFTLVEPGVASVKEVETLTDNIMELIYIEAGLCTGMLLLFLIYFPAKPPTPPSASAAVPRTEFRAGLKLLAKNWSFWLLTLCYGLQSIFVSWGNVWNVSLERLGLSEQQCGWLGFYTTLVGSVAGVVVSYFTDRFLRWMKTILVVCLTFGAVGMTVSALLILGFLPANIVLLYISIILAGTCNTAAAPVFYELASEIAYPVEEGTVGLMLGIFNGAVAILFLLVLEIPDIGTSWSLYCVWAAFVLQVILVLWVQASFRRLDVDDLTSKIRQENVKPSTSQSDVNRSIQEEPEHEKSS